MLAHRSFLITTLVLALGASSEAQGLKVNRPLPLSPTRFGADVEGYAVAPDENRVVYLAREAGDARAELYSLPLDGPGPAVPLTRAIPAEEIPVARFLGFASKGALVLFVTESHEEIPGGAVTAKRLYRVPSLGDAKPELVLRAEFARIEVVGESVVCLTRDNLPEETLLGVALDGRSEPVVLAPDAELIGLGEARVVFRQGPAASPELWSVLPDGTGMIRVDGLPGTGGPAEPDARLTPDGESVVFRADRLTPGQVELFRVPIDGSAAPLRISGSLAPDRFVRPTFAFSPDSARVLFRSDREQPGRVELYVGPLDGSSTPVKVNGPFRNTTRINALRFADDGVHVLYVANALEPRRQQLFSAPADGSAPAILLTPFTRDADVASLSASGGRAFYLARADRDADELYSVPIDGSALPSRIGRVLAAGSGQGLTTYSVSEDGSRALFFLEQGGVLGLYSTPGDGSASQVRVDVSGRPTWDGARLDAHGQRVLFLSDPELDGGIDLLLRAADASSPPVRLNRELSPGDVRGYVSEYAWDDAGRRAVYVADESAYGVRELVAADLGRSGDHTVLTEPGSPPEGLVLHHVLGGRALYSQIKAGDSVRTLWSVPVDRHSPPVELATSVAVQVVKPTPDGETVLFRVDSKAQNATPGLHAVPIDGSSPPRLLAVSPTPNGIDPAFSISPDGSHVAFLGGTFGHLEVYDVPTDAGSVAIRISGDLVEGGSVRKADSADGPLLTLDSRFALYRADAEVVGRVELYRAAIDGSAPIVKLSGPLLHGNGVAGPCALTLDGQSVLFRAELREAGRIELFRAPLDGSAPPERLSGDMGRDGDVGSFVLTPDGKRVLYLADTLEDGHDQLFVSALDGGERGRVLNAPFAKGGGVRRVEVDRDGRFAVYLADQLHVGVPELFLAELESHTAPRRLSAPLAPGDGVDVGFTLTGDGRGVLYLAGDARTYERFGLFLAPFAADRRVKQVSGPTVENGGVHSFRISADGKRVLYLANQDSLTATELYFSDLVRPLAPARR